MCTLFSFVVLAALSAFVNLNLALASGGSDDEDNTELLPSIQKESKHLKSAHDCYARQVLAPQQFGAAEMLATLKPTEPYSGPSTDDIDVTLPSRAFLALDWDRWLTLHNNRESTPPAAKASRKSDKRLSEQSIITDALKTYTQCRDAISAERSRKKEEAEMLETHCESMLHAHNDALNHVSTLLENLKGDEALDWVRQQLKAREQDMSLSLLNLHRFMIQFDLEHTYGLLTYIRANLFPQNTPSSVNKCRLDFAKSFPSAKTIVFDKYSPQENIPSSKHSPENEALAKGATLRGIPPSCQDFILNPPERARPKRLYGYYTLLHSLMNKISEDIKSLSGEKGHEDERGRFLKQTIEAEYNGDISNLLSDTSGKRFADLMLNSATACIAATYDQSTDAKCQRIFNETMGVSAKEAKKGANRPPTRDEIERAFSRSKLLDDPNWEFLQNLKHAALQYETLQQKLLSLSTILKKRETGKACDESVMVSMINDLKGAVRAVEFFDFKAPSRRVVLRSRNLAFYAFLDSLTASTSTHIPPKNLKLESQIVTTPALPFAQPHDKKKKERADTLESNNNNVRHDTNLLDDALGPYDTSYDPLQLHAFHQERKKALRNNRENETSATAASLKAMETADQDYRETFHNFLRTIHLTRLKMHQFESEIKGRGFTLEITQTGNGSQCRVFPAPHNPIFGEDDYYKRAYFTFHIVHGSKDSVIPHAYLKQIRNGFASVFGLYER